MRRRFIQAAAVFIVVLAAAQLVRPQPANQPIYPDRTIQAHLATTSELPAILNRACSDCHSNATVSEWYTHIAPLSWLMAHEVTAGRKAINFSEWAGYTPDEQRVLLALSCDDVRSGKMPGPYTFFKPHTRLSAEEIETICAAARHADARAAGRLDDAGRANAPRMGNCEGMVARYSC
jgi:hypothetical protein